MYVVGLMSGTSLDGIDAALVDISPDLKCKFIDGYSLDYSEGMREKLQQLFAPVVAPKLLCEMNFLLGEYFANAVINLQNKTGIKPDLIGSHGVTFYHNPSDEKFEGLPLKSTMQIGEGAVIAERTGITTVCDFRPQDISASGEGAPLVPFADKVFFFDKNINRAVLNLGGIANVTVLSSQCDIFAFDTGPANMLIDAAMRKFFNKNFDKDGEIAKSGKVNIALLNSLLEEPYLKLPPPKSTGRELFGENYLNKILSEIDDLPDNIITTLTVFTVKSVRTAFDNFIFPKTPINELILGGGGAYNLYMKELFKQEFEPDCKIRTHEDFGISNKYKEAIAFALLAYCTYKNIPNNIKTATGAVKDVVLGKIIRKEV